MTTARAVLNRDTVSGEALFILKNLRDNSKQGRSNKLAEVKTALEPAVSLEFDAYFFFLRKFHYIAMDREAQLKLTDSGERVVDGADLDRFSGEVGEFFSEQLAPVDEPIVDGSLPFETESSTDDLSVETADLSPPPAPTPAPAPRPIRRAPAPAEAGADLDGRYTRGEAIGGGPLGSVYRGKHLGLGTDVCIKELKDIFGYFSFLQRGEVLKRLKRELCAQAQVRHPAVVSIIDQGVDGARPYVVMELLNGSLRDRLDRAGGKSLPVAESIRAFLQLSYALRAAHGSGLTHHNIKPENVLFDACGNARLGDFGLSRVIEVEPGKGLPQVFVGTGSLSYFAPELITRKDAGPAADVYGLGILLYEMLTGGIPGRRSPLPSEVNAEVPSKLDPIFDKMTHDRRESRYPDFDAMLDEFYGAFSDGEFLHRGDLVLSSEPAGA
ncbi:MAG: serine/threonine protein kinase [Myxococcaceae bacterium]|nr:MAG: serine/threonine protein kinase [Myxococcaceae bacterium]